MSHEAPLGVILAGGRNVRYGKPKALETVGGKRIIDRVRDVLGAVTDEIVLIANEPETYTSTGLPMRPDALTGLGPVGGIHAALLWARERGRPGILAVACDMPFVPAKLLDELLAARDGADAVVPESPSRRGVEPLCAYYATSCIPAIEAQAAREDRRVIGFYDDIRVRRLPMQTVRRHGDPELLFMNVNTPEEKERAEAIAREVGGDRTPATAPRSEIDEPAARDDGGAP